jgi:hypothetical protein
MTFSMFVDAVRSVAALDYQQFLDFGGKAICDSQLYCSIETLFAFLSDL